MDFDSYLASIFGDDLPRFLEHPRIPMFLRANTLLIDPTALPPLLKSYGIEATPAPLSALPAWRVVSHPLERAPGVCLHQFLGHYVIQSLGSMLPPLLLDPQPGETILDLCAAPGSKSSQIAAMMQGQGHLWVNDLAGRRINPLSSTLDAVGAINTSTVNCAGERLPRRLNVAFDRVLADVPCSGLGRADNVSHNRNRWIKRDNTPSNMPELQYRLLLAALKLVKPGGRVVYSTCSLDPAENEAVLHQVVSRLPVRLIEPPDLGGLVVREGRTRIGHEALHPSLVHARRLMPFDNPTEGFFAAALELTEPLSPRFAAPDNPSYDDEIRPTLAADHPDVAPILEDLAQLYGVDPSCFASERYLLRKKQGKMTVTAPHIHHVWQHANRHGTAMAVARRGHWRLSHSRIQALGERITRNRVDLDPDQFRVLARDARVPLRPDQFPPTPHPAIAAEGRLPPFVSGLFEDGVLRWKQSRRYVLPTEW